MQTNRRRSSWSVGLGLVVLAGCGQTGPGLGDEPAPEGTVDPTHPRRSPLLAEIDTDRTLAIAAGSGSSVFIEYASHGHWRLHWTCDGRAGGCTYDVTVSVADGEIANPLYVIGIDDGHGGTASAVNPPQKAHFSAHKITREGIDGLTFDTKPGAVITLAAQLDGMADASRFVFVQSGVINGGFRGPLSDSIRLEPSSP